jgi:hypothetical protein
MAKTATRKSATRRSSTAKKSSASGSSAAVAKRKPRKVSSKRELINTGTDKRYARRSKGGQFKESDDVSRSLSSDRRRKAKTKAKKGQGDRGD